MNQLSPHDLFERARTALAITDHPSWPVVEEPGFIDTLCFLANASDGYEPEWLLARHREGTSAPSFDEAGDEDDFLPIDAAIAFDLLRLHFARWLGERGWQVQFSLRKQRHVWRLADCLSFAEGGGDRLDADYPFGDDEFAVLCDSVRTLAHPV